MSGIMSGVFVLELQRVGCESVELSIDEITTDSVARAFKVDTDSKLTCMCWNVTNNST